MSLEPNLCKDFGKKDFGKKIIKIGPVSVLMAKTAFQN